jgi:hypothetical protein
MILKITRRAAGAECASILAELPDPSLPYAPYERTRAFYEAVGFEPLEEITEIWGPENPCPLMIMPVSG